MANDEVMEFDFTGSKTINPGGGMPPGGSAYRMKLVTVETKDSKSSDGQNWSWKLQVSEGPSTGCSCYLTLPLPNGGDNDEFFTNKIRTALQTIGIPESSLGKKLRVSISKIIGLEGVFRVEERTPGEDGKRRIDVIAVPPDFADSALNGDWPPVKDGEDAPARSAAPARPTNGSARPTNGSARAVAPAQRQVQRQAPPPADDFVDDGEELPF